MKIFKADQKILNKYLNGKKIKQTLQTPLKNVRAYTTEDNQALFISTQKGRERVSSLLALIASQKGWNLSINTEGSYLVCLLQQ
jgi:hypothetical protein